MVNVVLKDIRKTIEITLPSFPESKVVLYNSLLFGDMKEIEEMKDDLGKGILTLKFMIKSWNFTSEDGKALEVNETNLNILPIEDLTLMLNKVGEYFKETAEKKSEPSKK